MANRYAEEGSDASAAKEEETTMGHVLHVARDKRDFARHDLGSVLCLNVLDLLPSDAVQVREWDARAPRPAWLTGTPTLVAPTDEVFQGHQALAYLQRLAVDTAATKHAKTAPPAVRRTPPPAAAAPATAAPARTDENDVDGSSLWESRIGDGERDDEDEEPARKITGDDLARAMRAREQGRAPTAT